MVSDTFHHLEDIYIYFIIISMDSSAFFYALYLP